MQRKKIAVFDKTLHRKISYGDLLVAAFALSFRLKKCPERFIGIMLPTSVAAMVAILATLIAGKTPVMINYVMGPEESVRRARERCGVKTIITSKKLLERRGIESVSGMIFAETVIAGLTMREKLWGLFASYFPSSFISPGTIYDYAVILFTTGSEKEPKIVPLTHKNICSNVEGMARAVHITSSDVIVAVLPFFHVFGFTATFILPLWKGASIVAHSNPLDYASVVGSVKEHQGTFFVATPTFYAGYLKKSSPGDFSSMRVMVSGADKLSRELQDEFTRVHGITIMEGYGTTETSPAISINRREANRPGSIGQPLDNLQVKIVDMENGQELARGKEGKILVKGDSVMEGYYRDPEATKACLQEGWYDTGDIGVMDEDGYLWHRGRYKRFIKVAGEMVSLVAIENKLQQVVPPETMICVVEIPAKGGHPEIVVATTKAFDEEACYQHLVHSFPRFAVPKRYVLMEELPIQGSGKIDFRKVQALCVAKLNELG